jgi:hypothetical protein
MNIDDSDEHDSDHGNGHDHSAPAADPVLIALQLCTIANNKTLAAAVKKLDRLDRQYADTQDKLASLTAQAAELETVLTQRAAELDARERTIIKREDEFASSLEDARRELYAHHNRIAAAHRQLVHRIMSTAGITGNWNFDLQGVPSWEQLKRQIADLPDDLPAAPPAEVVTENVREDWVGHTFVPGSSLTRTIRGAA